MINRSNDPVKKSDQVFKNYTLFTRNYFKYNYIDRLELNRIENTKKKEGLFILISKRLDFKARNTTRDKNI